MNAVSTRMDGMSGAFSTAKDACSTLALCSRPTFADAVEHLVAELQAVLDLRRGAHVEHARMTCVGGRDVDARRPGRRRSRVGHPARRAAAGALVRQREHRRRRAPRREEGVGVDRDEQVGLRARALATRWPSGTKKSASRVSIARMPGWRSAVAQLQRDREHDVLLAQAARADGARVPRRRGRGRWPR